MDENLPAGTTGADTTNDKDEVAQWLAEAEIAAKNENWDETIALYRKALAVDRIREGVEAKLQWALRMKDIDKLYRDGKAKMEAGEYEAALVPLRKARVMYASHYKDVDDLIVEAQTHVQQDKWEARPDEAKNPGSGKRNPIFYIGVVAVLVAGVLMLAWLWLLGNPLPGQGPVLSPNIPPVSGTTRTTDSGLRIIEVQRATWSACTIRATSRMEWFLIHRKGVRPSSFPWERGT